MTMSPFFISDRKGQSCDTLLGLLSGSATSAHFFRTAPMST